jgi:hypothetical protein
MGEVELSAEAAVLANRIRRIDRDLDGLERKVSGYISQGLRYGGALNIKQRALDDEERTRLLRERADSVEQLRTLTSGK